MSGTEDYLNAIREARAGGKSIDLDFASIPRDVDRDALASELADGLDEGYAEGISRSFKSGKGIALNFAEINPPKSFSESMGSEIGKRFRNTQANVEGAAAAGSKRPVKVDEDAFQKWYAVQAEKQGIDPNPDAPEHFYDYRSAYAAGAAPDEEGHWPSEFKQEGHPRMIIDGINTKTGEKAGVVAQAMEKMRGKSLGGLAGQNISEVAKRAMGIADGIHGGIRKAAAAGGEAVGPHAEFALDPLAKPREALYQAEAEATGHFGERARAFLYNEFEDARQAAKSIAPVESGPQSKAAIAARTMAETVLQATGPISKNFIPLTPLETARIVMEGQGIGVATGALAKQFPRFTATMMGPLDESIPIGLRTWLNTRIFRIKRAMGIPQETGVIRSGRTKAPDFTDEDLETLSEAISESTEISPRAQILRQKLRADGVSRSDILRVDARLKEYEINRRGLKPGDQSMDQAAAAAAEAPEATISQAIREFKGQAAVAGEEAAALRKASTSTQTASNPTQEPVSPAGRPMAAAEAPGAISEPNTPKEAATQVSASGEVAEVPAEAAPAAAEKPSRWIEGPAEEGSPAPRFLDVQDGDIQTAKAAVVELESGGFAAVMPNGELIKAAGKSSFPSAEAAIQAAEAEVAAIDGIRAKDPQDLSPQEFAKIARIDEGIGADVSDDEIISTRRDMTRQAILKGEEVPERVLAADPEILTPSLEKQLPAERIESATRALPKISEAAKMSREDFIKAAGGKISKESAELQHEILVRAAIATGRKPSRKALKDLEHLAKPGEFDITPPKGGVIEALGVDLSQAVPATQAAAAPVDMLRPELGLAIQTEAAALRSEILAGNPGGRTFDYEAMGQGGTPTVRGYGSTYPEAYAKLVEAGYGKDAIINALDKIIEGEGRDRGVIVEAVKGQVLMRMQDVDDEAISTLAAAKEAGESDEALIEQLEFDAAEAEIRREIMSGKQPALMVREDGEAYGSDQTKTPAFKKWFGESKVVDDKGNPLVVYHGTKSNFNIFRPKGGKRYSTLGGEESVKSLASFFSSEPEFAARFGDRRMEVYLSIQNPVDLTEGAWGQRDGKVLEILKEKFGEQAGFHPPEELWQALDDKRVVDGFKALGYDGVFLRERGPGDDMVDVYATFAPTQIKSATGNSGKFNPKNPSIVKEAMRIGIKQSQRQEAEIAFGGMKEAEQVLFKFTASLEEIRKSVGDIRRSKVAQEIREKGSFSFVGMKAPDVADVAEMVALFRNPHMEHFQVIMVKKGVVVAHRVITSGIIDMALVPQEFKLEMLDLAKKHDPDSILAGHNHPTGKHQASKADIQSTLELASIFGSTLKGHIVTNDKNYTLISRWGDVEDKKFLTPKENFDKAGKTISDHELAAAAAREHTKSGRYAVILLDAHLRMVGVESLPADADINLEVSKIIEAKSASKAILGVGEGVPVPAVIPHRVEAVVVVSGNGAEVKSEKVGYFDLIAKRKGGFNEDLDALEEHGVTHIAEPGAEMARPKRPMVVMADGTRISLDKLRAALKRGEKPIQAVIRDGKIYGKRGHGAEMWIGTLESPAPSKLPKGPQVKAQVKAATGLGPEKTVAVPESFLMKLRMRMQAQGAKAAEKIIRAETTEILTEKFEDKLKAQGDKAAAEFGQFKQDSKDALHNEKLDALWAKQELRAKIISEFRSKISDKKVAQDMLIAYIEAAIPKAEQGNFLRMVKSAASTDKLPKAFIRIDIKAEDIRRKELIATLKEDFKKILEAGNIDIKYKQQAERLLADVGFAKPNAETIERLENLQKHVERQRAAGNPVEIPQGILDEMKRLHDFPVGEIPTGLLEAMAFKLESIMAAGKVSRRIKGNLQDIEVEKLIKELVAGTVPITARPIAEALPGEDLPKGAAFDNAIAKGRNAAQHVDLAISPPDVVFDLLDGSKGYSGPNYVLIKKRVDGDFSGYLRDRNDLLAPVRALIDKHGLDDKSMEKIWIHAMRIQPNGMDYLQAQGLGASEIRLVTLTNPERQVYEKMREQIESILPRSRAILQELENRDIEKIPNYFPVSVDFSKATDFEVFKRMGDALAGIGKKKSTTAPGSLKERHGTKLRIERNAWKIFKHHIDDMAYYVNMEKYLRILYRVIGSEEYIAAAGDRGATWVSKWLDLMLRKGGMADQPKIEILDILRRNVGVAQLGFSLPSFMVQNTALLDGMALVGGQEILRGVFDVATDKEWRTFLHDNFQELRERFGDDPAIAEAKDGEGSLARIQEMSMKPLQLNDFLTASSVAAGAYRKNLAERGIELDLSKPDAEAISWATLMMRRTQASSLFKDAPLAISRGAITNNRSFEKALLQYKTFALGRWSLIRHDAARLGIAQGDVGRAAQVFGYLSMATLLETGIRAKARALQIAILVALGLAVEESIRQEDDFDDRFWKQWIGNIPFVGDALSGRGLYRSDVPAIDAALKGLNSVFGMPIRMKDVENGREAAKELIVLLEAIGKVAGVPGTSQAARLARFSLSDRKIYFPLANELRELEKKAKSKEISDDEGKRRRQLLRFRNGVHRNLNRQWQEALEAGDDKRAKEVLNLYKTKLQENLGAKGS